MDATAWAFIALIVFVGGVVYLKVPGMITKALDDRTNKVRDDLEEARKLREEAQAMLAEFQAKRKAAEKEAEEIVAGAKHEAAAIAEEAAKKTAEFVERRTAIAEQKIEQAEASALEEVRSKAIDRAMTAAEELIAGKITAAKSTSLIKEAISEVKTKLN